MKYYKIYHYSKSNTLKFIDPHYYGTGVSASSELRRRGKGIDQSFYYVVDKPEEAVWGHRYEIYLPYEWKALIYDVGYDDKDFRAEAVRRLKSNGEYPLEYLRTKTLETLIQENHYVGYTNSSLPNHSHVIVLFYALSIKEPVGQYSVFDWDNKLIETSKKRKNGSDNTGDTIAAHFPFFNQRVSTGEERITDIISDYLASSEVTLEDPPEEKENEKEVIALK